MTTKMVVRPSQMMGIVMVMVIVVKTLTVKVSDD